jgi:peptidylprolyl isomerase
MHRSFALAAGAALLLVLAAAAPARADDPVIANLGTTPVKASEIKDFVDGLNPQQRAQADKDPKIMEQVVRSAIGQRLVLQEAAKAGWDKKPDVAAQIARARDQVVFTTYMRSIALSASANYPTDADVKAAYDANRDRLLQYHIAQIYLADPPGADPAALRAVDRKAHDIDKRAKAKGADFAALARANSEDPTSAAKGGELGWFSENQLLPEILGAVAALSDKGVSEPVHVAGGWHIVTLLGTKPADFDQVKNQIAGVMREQKMAQASQAYVEKLLNDSKLTVNETAAASLFGAQK